MPSEKILDAKKQAVAALTEEIKKANVGILVDYKGINVADDTKLRKDLREAGDSYKVVKNTLLKRALADAGVSGLDELLEGTTALATGEDYVSAAKVLASYAKDNKDFKLKGGFLDGAAVDAAAIKNLAELPSKEVLVAQVLGGLNAPISGFVTVLNGTLKGLVVALNAVAEKQAAAQA
ncbi:MULTISPECIES: 50S ribosomal protein L10 [Caproicibacterium]|uniref:Large ribosomal subunit protein uL10 n=1 Tax=Caproicibacterium argilliputei TaxID=3030016 RepID=A0AA97D845_9FIRM|nr:50S ribosomal protein L10 [Caproicibacterium argilliputei]WOC31991.1 50S ribosomal protein L10 [Caproicibacterium argilliputei]